MSESKLTRKIISWLKNNYPEAVILKHADRFTSGIPDIQVIHNGKSYFFELKFGKNKVTAIQDYVMKQLIKAGATVRVCRDIECVKETMREI